MKKEESRHDRISSSLDTLAMFLLVIVAQLSGSRISAIEEQRIRGANDISILSLGKGTSSRERTGTLGRKNRGKRRPQSFNNVTAATRGINEMHFHGVHTLIPADY